jgi:glycosyltransferase involved in cell wall biosynthesis
MKVLAVTNMYPTDASPAHGTFVRSQVESLRSLVDIEVLHIDRASLGKSAYFSVRRQVRQAISAINPDIVHVMNGGALAFFTATAVRHTPLVISFCGSDLLGDPQLSWKRRIVGRATVLASKAAAMRADAIIAESKQLAAQVPPAVAADKVHVIPNGVDFNQFRPLDRGECQSRLGWNPDEFQVLFTGNPDSETKRFKDATKAVECARARGIPARLQLMRGVRHDEVPLWLNAADVLLLSSVHEGSPNIVKESLACECPVVSTDVGDVAERIEGITGCYLCSRDVESLTDGLDAVHRRGARLRCRSQIAPISTDAIAKRVESVYRGIAEFGGYARKELRAHNYSA